MKLGKMAEFKKFVLLVIQLDRIRFEKVVEADSNAFFQFYQVSSILKNLLQPLAQI